jgi:phosphotransferase system  glucose/maltose/N-acetylglucosamine-specific IIC component
MTITRLTWTILVYALMAIGLLGVYLFSMLVYTSFIDEVIYPLQHVNDRNGILYPLVCMAMGGAAFFFYREFLKMEREERAGLKASNSVVSTMRDTY